MRKFNLAFILMASLLLSACGEGSFTSYQVSRSLNDLAPGDNQGASETPIEPEIPVEEVEEAVPGKARWEDVKSGSRAWTLYLYDQIEIEGPDLLNTIPKDIENFCPNYTKMTLSEVKDFWIYLISGIGQFESNYKPETSYTEGFNDSNGDPVVSRGVLQISIESGRGYDCELATANDLHDPFKNLLCGMKILNRWVGRDGVIRGLEGTSSWKGGARYWSVLRKLERYESIRGWTKAQSYCKK